MNNPESVVTSLAVSRNLEKAGKEQKAIWFWTVMKDEKPFLYGAKKDGSQPTLTPPTSDREYFAAFIAEEILRELPNKDILVDGKVFNPREESMTKWILGETSTLANAAGEMWIYLKENNLLTASQQSS